MNNSSLRLFWKAFVCNVTWWPFCTWSLEWRLKLKCSSEPTLFFREGIDRLLAILKCRENTEGVNHSVAAVNSEWLDACRFQAVLQFRGDFDSIWFPSWIEILHKAQMANVHYGNLFHQAVIKRCRRKQLMNFSPRTIDVISSLTVVVMNIAQIIQSKLNLQIKTFTKQSLE